MHYYSDLFSNRSQIPLKLEVVYINKDIIKINEYEIKTKVLDECLDRGNNLGTY